MGSEAAHRVSPVAVNCSLVKTPMSPAMSLSTAMSFFAAHHGHAAGLAVLSLLALTKVNTRSSGVPE